MKYPAAAVLCIAFASCTGTPEMLAVKQFTLRDQESSILDDPFMQNEKLRRLYGAVSLKERKDRLGQYYTVIWHDPKKVGLRREIIFRYQQGGSGSRIKEMRRTLPSDQVEGNEEFTIIGDNYFENGRVLAWKIDFTANDQIIASKQSYLWE